MKMSQVWQLTNEATKQTFGETEVLNEDLSNLVDIGDKVHYSQDSQLKWLANMGDQVGKLVVADQLIESVVPSLDMDAWEYGSICEKIRVEMPEASVNESWQLENGQSYDPNIYYQTKVHAKFFNKRVTFEVPQSITEMQYKSAFQNGTQLGSFVEAMYNAVKNALTIRKDALKMACINSFTAEVLHANYDDGNYSAKSTIQAVNLLYLYKQKNPNSTLTAETCITDPEFIRFATYTMNKTRYRMSRASKLFNLSKATRLTPANRLHFVALADFTEAATSYLQSDTYHKELVALEKYDKVPYWQGTGTEYGFNDVSKIDVKTPNNNVVSTTGILAVMFDRYALGVSNLYERTTTEWVAKAEFWNNFHKVDVGYYNDHDENFVVFFVA